MSGFICGPSIYEYKGWIFEYGMSSGPWPPWPLRKDGTPRKHGYQTFLDAMDEFMRLPKEQQEAHRVGGGCVRF